MVEGSGTVGGLGCWGRQRGGTTPWSAGQSPEGIGTPTGTYGKKNEPAKSLGGIGSPPGKSGGASRGRKGKDGPAPSSATGRSNTSSSGSSSETSGLAVSEIWLPQRARAVILPSVSSSSPRCRRILLRVQKTVSRTR